MVQKLLREHVRANNGKFCGLLVRHQFASLFLREEQERKVYEIRSHPLHFLKEGEKIALISTGGHVRQVVGILEFLGNVKIKNSSFDKYYNLHRISLEDFQAVSANWANQEFCFAWHFELTMAFESPVSIPMVKGPEVWHYFSLGLREPLHEDRRLIFIFFKYLGILSPLEINGSISFSKDESGETTSPLDSPCDFRTPPMKRKLSFESALSTAQSAVRKVRLPDECTTERSGSSSSQSLGLVPPTSMIPLDVFEDGSATGLYLQEYEWNGLLKGGKTMLRSFKTREEKTLVVLRKSAAHYVVGALEIEEVVYLSNGISHELVNRVRDMYPSSHLNALRAAKSAYEWRIKSVSRFEPAGVLTHHGTKFKNRTFNITPSMVQLDGGQQGPERQCLKETAKFFFNLMDGDRQRSLCFLFKAIDQRTIRVGSTCSGSDICITVLQKTVDFMNAVQVASRE